MRVARGLNEEEARAVLETEILRLCGIAFQQSCRLIARVTFRAEGPAGVSYHYEFAVLSPGEFPPAGMGWSMYEDRSGFAQERPA